MRLTVLVGLNFLCFAHAAVHVVSPSGRFPTDQFCKDWLQSTNLSTTLSSLSAGDIVYLCDGEYYTGYFKISEDNCTISSYPCDQVNAGIKPILTLSNMFRGTFSVDPISRRWIYDISSYQQDLVGQAVIEGLWIGGVRYYPARYPNLIDPYNPVGKNTSEFIYSVGQGAGMVYNQEILEPINLKNMDSTYWVGSTLRFRETDWGYAKPKTILGVKNGQLNLSTKFTNFQTISGGGFFIESNQIGELDAPGEFVFDPVTFKLFVLPMDGHFPSSPMVFLAQPTSASSRKEAILTITGKFCVVDSLSFRYGFVGIDGLISLTATNVDIRDMLNIGVQGNLHLVGSYLSDIGSAGAFLLKGGLISLVRSCTIRNVGLWAGYHFQPAGVKCLARCHVEKCTFDGMGYAAIDPDSDFSVIADNVIKNVMLGLSDGGAIYFRRMRGLIIARNTIINIVGNTISGAAGRRDVITSGVYLDVLAHNATIVGNTIITNYSAKADLRQSCIKVNNGNITIADNVCVGGKVDVAMNSEAVIKGLVIDRNVFKPTPGTPGQKFPILIRYLNPNLSPPYLPTNATFKSIAYNTFCRTAIEADGAQSAAWNPIFIGKTPVFDRNNIGIGSFVDVSTNRQDSSGKCVFDPLNLEIHPLATDQAAMATDEDALLLAAPALSAATLRQPHRREHRSPGTAAVPDKNSVYVLEAQIMAALWFGLVLISGAAARSIRAWMRSRTLSCSESRNKPLEMPGIRHPPTLGRAAGDYTD